MDAQNLPDLKTNGESWIEARHGLLENHPDSITSNGSHLGIIQCEHVIALEKNAAGLNLTGW